MEIFYLSGYDFKLNRTIFLVVRAIWGGGVGFGELGCVVLRVGVGFTFQGGGVV